MQSKQQEKTSIVSFSSARDVLSLCMVASADCADDDEGYPFYTTTSVSQLLHFHYMQLTAYNAYERLPLINPSYFNVCWRAVRERTNVNLKQPDWRLSNHRFDLLC